MAVFFSGNNSYSNIPSNVFGSRKIFTVIIKFSSTDNRSGSDYYLHPTLFGYDTGGDYNEFCICLKNGNLYLWHGIGSSNDLDIETNTFLADGNKHTIVSTCDGTNIKLYSDNILVGTSSIYGGSTDNVQYGIGWNNRRTSTCCQFILYDLKIYSDCIPQEDLVNLNKFDNSLISHYRNLNKMQTNLIDIKNGYNGSSVNISNILVLDNPILYSNIKII